MTAVVGKGCSIPSGPGMFFAHICLLQDAVGATERGLFLWPIVALFLWPIGPAREGLSLPWLCFVRYPSTEGAQDAVFNIPFHLVLVL